MMEQWLPLFFVSVMGLALLVYIILDGYDLGIGLLLPLADDTQKDQMIAAIGPFWDANETWIVLGVGVLLIAFPRAHGIILTELYLPVTIMLIGLVLRGVSFDFRVKAHSDYKGLWNRLFFLAHCWRPHPRAGCWVAISWGLELTASPMSLPFLSPSPCLRCISCLAVVGCLSRPKATCTPGRFIGRGKRCCPWVLASS